MKLWNPSGGRQWGGLMVLIAASLLAVTAILYSAPAADAEQKENPAKGEKSAEEALLEKFRAAAERGDLEEVKQMVKESPDLIAADEKKQGMTSLHEASFKGHFDVVQFLVGRGADPNGGGDPNKGATPLHYAGRESDARMMQVLIGAGAKPDGRDYRCRTPLHRVSDPVRHDFQTNCAEILVKAGAYMEARDREGMTPLHYAVADDNLFLTKWFCKNGADPNAPGLCGQTPLHLAPNGFITFWLLQAGASPLVVEKKDGRMPLHMAAMRGDVASVGLLLEGISYFLPKDRSPDDIEDIAPYYTSRAELHFPEDSQRLSGLIRQVEKRDRSGKTPKDLALEGLKRATSRRQREEYRDVYNMLHDAEKRIKKMKEEHRKSISVPKGRR